MANGHMNTEPSDDEYIDTVEVNMFKNCNICLLTQKYE